MIDQVGSNRNEVDLKHVQGKLKWTLWLIIQALEKAEEIKDNHGDFEIESMNREGLALPLTGSWERKRGAKISEQLS